MKMHLNFHKINTKLRLKYFLIKLGTKFENVLRIENLIRIIRDFLIEKIKIK